MTVASFLNWLEILQVTRLPPSERCREGEMSEQNPSDRGLFERERRFRLLVEGVVDYAISILDPKGQVINWNAGAQRIQGYTAPEIIGQHFRVASLPSLTASRLASFSLPIRTNWLDICLRGQRFGKEPAARQCSLTCSTPKHSLKARPQVWSKPAVPYSLQESQI